MTRGAGKDEEKVMGPLFPRLHVNDAAKGGPRAPPRNKMALYEQFTVPSHRSSPAAVHRRGGSGGSSLVPSTLASQVYVCERPLFRPFYVPSNEPVHSSEKITNNFTDGRVNSSRNESGRSSTQLKHKDFCTAGSTAEFSSQHRDDNNLKNSSGKKLNNDEEFMVPSIFCPGIPQHSTQEHAGKVQEKSTPFCTTSSYKNRSMMSKSSAKCSTDKKQLEGINVSNVRSMNSPQIREKEPAQISINVEVEKSSSIQASKEKMGNTDAKASSIREKVSTLNVSEKPHPGKSGYQARSRNESVMETQNCTTMRNAVSSKPCADVENSNTVSNILEGGLKEYVSNLRSRNSPRIREKEPAQTSINVGVKEKSSSIQASKEKLGNTGAKSFSNREKVSSINVSEKPHPGNSGYQVRSRNQCVTETQNHTTMRNVVSSKPCADVENSNRVSHILEGGLKEYVEKRKRSAGHHDVEQNDDLSDSSVESMPGLEISPDDVVGAIGPKRFWKARRAIVNQQRVFAVQVFELHRLIKVQKLIASSPHLLIEVDPCLGDALESGKNELAEGNLKTQPLLATKNKEDTQPTLQQPEFSKEKTEENQPSPSRDDGLGGGHHGQAATNGTFTSNLPAMPVAPDNKQNNWCVHPPQNQWLVPVMSLSEGLVYKPYTGPCPPAGSFLTPFYANCAPPSLPSTAGDFMNSAYGVPIPHQPQHMGVPGAPPVPMNYFPPFSLPVMNPVASSSAVEQVSHVAVSQPDGHVEQHSRISCNMSHLRSEAFSGEFWKFHASRDSEPQGSSASSPFDKGDGRGPGSLFPTASVGNAHSQPQPSGILENQARVIRVVPHNAQTASESAARIFRSIQMERQQNDS